VIATPHLVLRTIKNFNAMGVIRSWSAGTHWWHSTTKGKAGVVTVVHNRVKATTRILSLAENYDTG
jgi:hypothetical protein